MPYKRNADLPAPVRKSLPAGAQSVYRAAFNSAHGPGVSESKAARIAWGAVKKAYRKDGASWVKR